MLKQQQQLLKDKMDFISNVWNKAASAIVPENGNSKESKAAANAQEATGAAQHENNAISEANVSLSHSCIL